MSEVPSETALVTDRRGVILLYHRIGSRVPDTHDLCVDVASFRDHMRHIRDHCAPVPLEEIVDDVATGNTPSRPVAVTFDDGYLEHLTIVAPILIELGIPATFFVNTESLNEPHECWWDVFERVMTSDAPLPPVLDLYGDGRWMKAVATPEDRTIAHRALIETVFSLSARDRQDVVTRVSEWSRLELLPRSTHRPMLRDEIGQLAELPGITIGAHSVHHLSLPRHGRDVQFREVIECKRELERSINRRVALFAYPYGELNGQTVQVVRDAGFLQAVTVERRPLLPGARPMLLPRMEIKEGDPAAFAAELRTAFAAPRAQDIKPA